ncbi:ComF family protein [Patescibacteria group bacterium]
MNSLPFPEATDPDVLSAVSYASPIIKKALWTLKYKKAKRVAKPLAQLIHKRLLLKNLESKWIIIPIPLSKKRYRERGFNQAELIAKHLSDISNKTLLIYSNVLYKNRHTISQVNIKNREKRLKNLKGVFVVKNTKIIKNKNILLLDDVSTTGTTIKEAKKALEKSGTNKVVGIVVASG